jgi:hypothetical protein
MKDTTFKDADKIFTKHIAKNKQMFKKIISEQIKYLEKK